MQGLIPYTLNIRGQLLDLSEPQVMGILNITPDSFYAESRKQTEEEIITRVEAMLAEGADIIDVGAYSSRPGAQDISSEEEMGRLRRALKLIREQFPHTILSVDTFRADIARCCVEDFEVDIINDISGGTLDSDMFTTIAKLGVPYILTHTKGTPQTMNQEAHYEQLIPDFAERLTRLRELGQKDIILDPGFGFAKNLEQNYQLMSHLDELKVFELPLLVGISRKRMVYELLNTTPEEALCGTTVLNTLALTKGANILRVHDVKACVEVRKIVKACLQSV